MDLLTTANLQTSTTSQKANDIANSVQEEGFSPTFPNLLFTQLTDLEEYSPALTNSALPLNLADVDLGTPVSEVEERRLKTKTTDIRAVNINRSLTQKELAGGNDVPLESLVTKRAMPLHHQSLLNNSASTSEPIKHSAAPILSGLQNPLSMTQSQGDSALRQTPVSPTPAVGWSPAFPQTTLAEPNQQNMPRTIGVPLTPVNAETEDVTNLSNNAKVLVHSDRTDSLQSLSASSSVIAAKNSSLTFPTLSSQNTIVATNDDHVTNVPMTIRSGIINAGASNSVISADLTGANPVDVTLPASGLAERSANEQPKLIPTLSQEQIFKPSVDAKPTTAHGIGLVQAAINSIQPAAKTNGVLVNNRLASSNISIAPSEALNASTTALADQPNHGLQSESLGFGGAQQITQPGHLVAKSGQSHYLGVAQFNDPQFSRHVSDQVLLMAGQGIQKAHISLNPNELGPLEIRLSVVDDEVSVQLASINPAVRESIEQAMPRLRELFDEAGLKLGEHDVSSEFADGKSSEFAGSENKSSYSNKVLAESQKDDAILAIDDDAMSSIDTYI